MAETPRGPEDLLAEQAVLSALLQPDVVSTGVADELFEALGPEDFARESHRVLYGAFRHLHSHGKPIDPTSLRDALEARKQLAAVGGIEYLTYLLDVTVSTASAVHHASIVRSRALERRVLVAGEAIVGMARTRAHEGEELAAQSERVLLEATDRASVRGPEALRALIWPTLELIEARHADPKHLIGVPSGLTDLDQLTLGWREGHCVVVAARPSVGKTALALHLARVAAGHGVPTAVFSLEMGREELTIRLLASEVGINSRDLELGRVKQADFAAISGAAGRVAALPLLIDDTPARTMASLRATSRRLKRRAGIGLIVVDYLQLLRPDERHENRNTEITAISQGLKALARDLNVPVVALSQLSRAVEGRGDKRPGLADLRDSGSIEQDADDVIFLWRDPKKQRPEPDVSPISVAVAKQRNGPTGQFDAWYEKRTGTWRDWSNRPLADAA